MRGDIFIILNCKPIKNGNKINDKLSLFNKNINKDDYKDYILETEVIDTGEGISKER